MDPGFSSLKEGAHLTCVRAPLSLITFPFLLTLQPQWKRIVYSPQNIPPPPPPPPSNYSFRCWQGFPPPRRSRAEEGRGEGWGRGRDIGVGTVAVTGRMGPWPVILRPITPHCMSHHVAHTPKAGWSHTTPPDLYSHTGAHSCIQEAGDLTKAPSHFSVWGSHCHMDRSERPLFSLCPLDLGRSVVFCSSVLSLVLSHPDVFCVPQCLRVVQFPHCL